MSDLEVIILFIIFGFVVSAGLIISSVLHYLKRPYERASKQYKDTKDPW